jgi:transposase InsO family protein
MAIQREFPGGVRGNGLKLISDNGSQPTATSFMRDMATLGIEHSPLQVMTIPKAMQKQRG